MDGANHERLVRAAHQLLADQGATVATAESLTGGLLAERLTAVAGASATFRGGVVAYATDVKAIVLGVSQELLDERGAVDPDVASAMAGGARKILEATHGLALTGVAGPEPQGGKPPGTVHVAVAGPHGERTRTFTRRCGERARNREHAVGKALDVLRGHLLARGDDPGRGSGDS